MAGQNSFKLRTPYLLADPRDIKLADPSLAYPAGSPGAGSSNPLYAGEFITFDASYLGVRPAAADVALKTWPVYYDPGDVSVQTLGQVPVLFVYGGLEVDTWIYDSTGLALGDPVCVGQVSINSVTDYRGLIDVGATTGRTVGYVTKMPTTANPGNVAFSTRAWDPMRVFLVP